MSLRDRFAYKDCAELVLSLSKDYTDFILVHPAHGDSKVAPQLSFRRQERLSLP